MIDNPIGFVFSMCFKLLCYMVKIVVLIFKIGLGWLFIGYFIDYFLLSGAVGTTHVILMIIAWGGTFIHFFGRKILNYLKKKNPSVNEVQQ